MPAGVRVCRTAPLSITFRFGHYRDSTVRHRASISGRGRERWRRELRLTPVAFGRRSFSLGAAFVDGLDHLMAASRTNGELTRTSRPVREHRHRADDHSGGSRQLLSLDRNRVLGATPVASLVDDGRARAVGFVGTLGANAAGGNVGDAGTRGKQRQTRSSGG